MENDFLQSLTKVCEILNKHSVQYLIIGGSAVALHGYGRPSMDPSGQLAEKPDLDFWYNPTYDNYYKVLNALHELGQDVSQLKAEKAPDPKRSFFRLERERFTLDLLPEVPGLSKFRSSFDKRMISDLGKVSAPVLCYEDLVTNKEKLARAKDMEDIKELRLRRGGQKK